MNNKTFKIGDKVSSPENNIEEAEIVEIQDGKSFSTNKGSYGDGPIYKVHIKRKEEEQWRTEYQWIWPEFLVKKYSNEELEIIGNKLGKMLGMKQSRKHGIQKRWQTSIGTKTGFGLIETLRAVLRDIDSGNVGLELSPE